MLKDCGNVTKTSYGHTVLKELSKAAISTIKELYFSFRNRKVTKASDIQAKQDLAKILKEYPGTFPSIDFLEIYEATYTGISAFLK